MIGKCRGFTGSCDKKVANKAAEARKENFVKNHLRRLPMKENRECKLWSRIDWFNHQGNFSVWMSQTQFEHCKTVSIERIQSELGHNTHIQHTKTVRTHATTLLARASNSEALYTTMRKRVGEEELWLEQQQRGNVSLHRKVIFNSGSTAVYAQTHSHTHRRERSC